MDDGFHKSLRDNLLDAGISTASFGLVGVPGALGLGEAPGWLNSAFGMDKAGIEDMEEATSRGQGYFLRTMLSGPDIAGLTGELLACA